MNEVSHGYNPQEILSRIGLQEKEDHIKKEVIEAAKRIGKDLVQLFDAHQGNVQLVISGASRKVALDLFKVLISWADDEEKEKLEKLLQESVRLNPKQNSELYRSGWQESGEKMTDYIGDTDRVIIFWEDHISQGEKAHRLLYRGEEEGVSVVVAGFVGKRDSYGEERILVGSGDPELYRLLEAVSMFRSAEYRTRTGLTQHRSAQKAPWVRSVFKGFKSGKVSSSLSESWENSREEE